MEKMTKIFQCLRYIAFFATILFPLSASAVDWRNAESRKITMIYPNSGGFSFSVDGPLADTNSSCPNRFHIGLSDVDREAKISSIITAFSADFTITVVYDHDYAGCGTTVDRFLIVK